MSRLPPKGYTIPPDTNYSSLNSFRSNFNSLIVTDAVSFFNVESSGQIFIDYTLSSVISALQTYGLAYKDTWNITSGPLVPTTDLSSVFVTMSGDENTFAIGSPDASGDIGSVYVFNYSNGMWSIQASLLPSDFLGFPGIGSSLSLSNDGNTLAIGGPNDDTSIGATWIFVRNGVVWSQQGLKIIASDYVGLPTQGTSVSLSSDGNTLAVGGPADNAGIGASWIYTRSGFVWTQQGLKIIASDYTGIPNQGISISVSNDGNTLAVGGPEDNAGIGAAWIYIRSGFVWTQQGLKLVNSNYTTGLPNQGTAVALSGNGTTLVFSGPLNTLWVFVKVGSLWIQINGPLIGLSEQGYNISISSDGNTIISMNSTGYIIVFVNNGLTWVQQGPILYVPGPYLSNNIYKPSAFLSNNKIIYSRPNAYDIQECYVFDN